MRILGDDDPLPAVRILRHVHVREAAGVQCVDRHDHRGQHVARISSGDILQRRLVDRRIAREAWREIVELRRLALQNRQSRDAGRRLNRTVPRQIGERAAGALRIRTEIERPARRQAVALHLLRAAERLRADIAIEHERRGREQVERACVATNDIVALIRAARQKRVVPRLRHAPARMAFDELAGNSDVGLVRARLPDRHDRAIRIDEPRRIDDPAVDMHVPAVQVQ
ncbi:hypothetical protein ABID76_005909 [Burkholderia ambifaria]